MQFSQAVFVVFLSFAAFSAAQPTDNGGYSAVEQREALPEPEPEFEIHERGEDATLLSRDAELFRRLGGNGACAKHGYSMVCKKNNGGRPPRMTVCGACRPTAHAGEYCLCDA